MNNHDPISNPSHYTMGKHEVIDIIASFGMEGDFCAGNVLKYFLRAPHKNGEEEDYKKARWYLDRINERDPVAFHFLFHNRTQCSPMHLPIEKIRVHWYAPLGGNEIQLHHVIMDWELDGQRREFIQNFHYASQNLDRCSKILDSLIDSCSDYDQMMRDEEL